MLNSVVISGPPAIGKTTVAKGIALEFNLTHLSGGDILKDLASEQGFSTGGDDWWDTEEGMQFLTQRKNNPEFDKNVDSKLKELFQNGGVVITSYTLPWIIDNGIKIWLAGNIENSAKRMQTRDNYRNDSCRGIYCNTHDPDDRRGERRIQYNATEP